MKHLDHMKVLGKLLPETLQNLIVGSVHGQGWIELLLKPSVVTACKLWGLYTAKTSWMF